MLFKKKMPFHSAVSFGISQECNFFRVMVWNNPDLDDARHSQLGVRVSLHSNYQQVRNHPEVTNNVYRGQAVR